MLDSPILNKDQIDQLLSDPLFKYQVIDTNYPVGQYEEGIKNTLQAITESSVSMVRDGVNLLILSDMNSTANRAPIPPVLVASAVDDALLKAGLRRNVNIIMQTAHAYTAIQIAQLIGIGGVEAIYPYPVFAFDPAEGINEEEFNRQRANYVNAIGDELLGIMSCVGISTLSAYRGCKTYNAIGLNEEITKILGVPCQFGGVGLQELSRMILTQHRMPLEEGDGKFNWSGQSQRLKIWNPKFTRAMIEKARGVYKEDFSQREKEADTLKRGRPLGWLRLQRSTAWNDENPMPVCILGGGAAGFYLAMALLESKLPIRITIIEQNEVNKFGLLGDGVAPDHFSTKNQAKIFVTVIKDSRVKYYGGIQVGRDVSFSDIDNNYLCVVDCRGAANDKKLDVSGSDIKRVINASDVYSIYNGKFKPFQKENWPFSRKSKNPILGVIGSGNVAADLARIFLSDPQKLEKTNINPIFLEYLAQEGPSAIRIFARCHPTDSKIGFKELNELRNLKGVSLCAYFDDTLIETTNLNEQQRKLYAFFSEIKNASYSPKTTKYIYFHFQMNIKHFKDMGSEVEATFVKGNSEEELFRTSNYIVAIGRAPAENNSRSIYSSGWITGEGGSLGQADDSAQKTMERIKQDFYEGKFNNQPVPRALPWELRSTVGNKEMVSILAWLEAGKPIVTIDDFREARQYAVSEGRGDSPKKQESSAVSSNLTSSTSSIQPRIAANCITVVEEKNKEERHLSVSTGSTQTVLEALKQSGGNFTPPYECDGGQTCGTCVVDIVVPPKKEVTRSKKETFLLGMNNHDSNKSVLACAHKAEDFTESILSFKR